MQTSSIHGMWSSRLAFILAATGSAVGLGNIWRFPYITSENGGGAFVLIYLLCILAVGLPVMFSEILIGRRGRMSPINSIRELADDAGSSRAWMGLGIIGVVAGFLILSFYSVVAGWTLHYGWLYLKELVGAGAPITDPGETFTSLLGNAGELTFWHGLFMIMTVSVVAFGVEKGLERAVSILMPILFVLLLILLGYGMNTGHFQEAVTFLFKPDWSQVSGPMIVTAMGQAFFTLSLGMCAIMTYGAYLPSDVNIPRVGVTIALADTAVALIAGLAIFPIVLAFIVAPDPELTGIPAGGPGLIFQSLPLAFASMPFGIFFGMLFFLLLSVAAWTSSISLMEPATAYLVESTNLSRKGAALVVALLGWTLGLASVFSFNIWSEVSIGGRDIMSAIEYVAADIMLPVGGLLTALFAGWVLSRKITRDELDRKMPNWAFQCWLWLTRVVTPALILIVLGSILGFF
ncbi:MAG: sodium-dependent transporter [Wenzhouxiangella sp.]|nr:MAG: sodium-dependent transporter [Wenzhouxiangella sp.]